MLYGYVPFSDLMLIAEVFEETVVPLYVANQYVPDGRPFSVNFVVHKAEK